MPIQTSTSQPWYRYPFVWLLFGLPAAAVIGGIVTFLIAARTDDGLVADDYYKRGKEINLDLRRDEAAAQIGVSAQLMLGADRRNVRILLNRAISTPLRIKLAHPTRAGLDQSAPLTAQSPQMFATVLPTPLEHSTWHVEISDEAGQWRLRGEWKIAPDQPFELGSHSR